MQSFYWFDFETFGINPAKDRPSQFAGIRTDQNFNIIGEPLNIMCKPADDFLPHPEACLVTGITPQQALKDGISERDFFRLIHLELSTAETCAVGYNNIRFDDEVIRFGFYRNFYDAYAREWQNGNSRWDILDMLRMTHALRPEGINWPLNEEGKQSFRLEHLSVANGIEHENAHDALADVYATIAMAKLVKEKQPRLFDFLFELRNKNRVMAEIDLVTGKPFVHCSGMLGGDHAYTGVMVPMISHPTNKNSVICLNLVQLEDDLSELSVEDIQQRIFTRQSELPEGVKRLPIKEVHYNKCPAVAPIGVLNEAAQERLGIDVDECMLKAEMINSGIDDINAKILQAYQGHQFEPVTNPDHALYSGGFFSPADKNKMDEIRQSDWQKLSGSQFNFNDDRLETLLFRYRARNAPDTLTDAEKQRWDAYRQEQFNNADSGTTLIYSELIERLDQLSQDSSNDIVILNAVRDYAESVVKA